MTLIEAYSDDAESDADFDADAVTPSSNPRSCTRRSVPSFIFHLGVLMTIEIYICAENENNDDGNDEDLKGGLPI